MAEDAVIIVVEVEGDADTSLSTRISEETACPVRTITKHGLAGDASTWLLMGNFLVTSFATLAPILANYIKQRQVKSIKVGDITIENPKQEDIDKAFQAWIERGSASTR
jgi:hypothetical protein